MNSEEDLLREILEDHARNPCGQGKLSKPSHCGEWRSPKTGNFCLVQLKVQNDQIIEMVARVDGSALAKACASIMCSELEGQCVEYAQATMGAVESSIVHGKKPPEWKGDLAVYQSLVKFPERGDCASLCWRSLGQALRG